MNNFQYIDEIIFIELIKFIKKTKKLNKFEKQIGIIIKKVFTSIAEKNEIISFLCEVVKDCKNFEYSEIINNINNKYKTFFALEELINFILEKLKKEKIIFLYDELDRCDDIFIKDFFCRIKQLFNYNNIIHIVFANQNYINNVFHNLNNDEKFIDKYFNYIYKIKPSVVQAIEEKWTEITKFSEKLFEYYDYKNTNFKKYKLNDLFLEEISYRDFIKYELEISKFFHRITIYNKNTKITTTKNALNWYEYCYQYDDILILFIVFLILKGYNEINSVEELEKIIEKYSIINYFDFDNYKLTTNSILTSIYQEKYGIYNENNSNAPKMIKINNEQDFLLALSIHMKRLSDIFIKSPFTIDKKNIDINNLKDDVHTNFNKLLNWTK